MRLRLTTCTKVVAALAVAVVAVTAAGPAHASNMGFKLNKVVSPKGPFPKGKNEVALPFKNPYATSVDVCNQFGLTGQAQTITVEQIFADSGGAGSTQCSPLLGASFALKPKVGIRITNNLVTAINSIIVGSDIPGSNVSIYPLGAFPKGQNFIPVLYHTTALTAKNLCDQFGMTGGTVENFNAATGGAGSQNCALAEGNVTLRLGESVLVKSNVPGTLSPVPAHF